MNTKQNDQPRDVAVLLQTIGRATVTRHGIPTFNEILEREPSEAVELIITSVGDRSGDEARVRELSAEVLEHATAGNLDQVRQALALLNEADIVRQTNHSETYYLIGVAVTLRAIAQARALIQPDIVSVLSELAAPHKPEGGNRG